MSLLTLFSYNSVVFEATVANDYMVVTASEAFADGIWTQNRATCLKFWPDPKKVLTYLQENKDSLTRLDNAACISAYGKQYVSEWSNVWVVTSKDAPYANESLLNLRYVTGEDSIGDWICDGLSGGARQCDTPDQKIADAAHWSILGTSYPDVEGAECLLEIDEMFDVSHCLAQPTKQACQVGIHSGILIIVLICNLIKIVCMVWTYKKLDVPIVTLGDAITCFLQRPDPSTCGFGPIDAGLKSWVKGRDKSSGMIWEGSAKSGFGAASLRRWFFCNIL